MKRNGASVLNYLHRCWRHRSRHSPSTSSSEMRSDKGRIGRGTSSWRGGFISRKKSSKNLLKVFSSLAEPAIASHSWRDQRQLEPGKKSALLWIIGWSDSLVARVGEGPRRARGKRGESHNRPTWRHKGWGVGGVTFFINPFNSIFVMKMYFYIKGSKLFKRFTWNVLFTWRRLNIVTWPEGFHFSWPLWKMSKCHKRKHVKQIHL